MHFAFVADRIPTPNLTGDPLHLWSMVKHLADSGHRITYVVIGQPDELRLLQGSELDQLWQSLVDLGVRVVRRDFPPSKVPEADRVTREMRPSLAYRITRILKLLPSALMPTFKTYDRIYNVAAIRDRIVDTMQNMAADAVFAFGFSAIGALRDLCFLPRVVLPGTLVDQFWEERLKYIGDRSWRWRIGIFLQVATFRRFSRWLLRNLVDIESVTWTAEHHAAWLREQGVECRYIPTPVPDGVGTDWEAKLDLYPKNNKPKIVHLGHLGGTAAMTGLYLLLKETLPILEQQLGEDGFELYFIGRKDMSFSGMNHLFNRPSVRLCGYVEDLTGELLSSDVFVVPIPYRVGMRSRLATGLSFGCCVVAHEVNRLANPEIIHEENVLLANDGEGFAACILRALRDDALRKRLRVNARRTYEQYFSLEAAGAQYADELERVAREFKNTKQDCL